MKVIITEETMSHDATKTAFCFRPSTPGAGHEPFLQVPEDPVGRATIHREALEFAATRYPGATIIDRTPEGYDALMNIASDLADDLVYAIRRIEVANAEGNPILSAWLPGARAALAAAGRPTPPMFVNERLMFMVAADPDLSKRWRELATAAVQTGQYTAPEEHDWVAATEELVAGFERVVATSPTLRHVDFTGLNLQAIADDAINAIFAERGLPFRFDRAALAAAEEPSAAPAP